MKEKKKNTKILLPILLVALLIIMVGGVTYAFFNYTRTGVANTFSVGRISFNTRQTETVNLSNLFPIDVTNGIPNDDTKVGTFELEITGDTDYVGGIEYLVSATNTHVTTSTGQIVPISLDVTVEGLGTANKNYFIARESKDSKIYKRLSGNGIMGDQQLLVGYIPQNTTLGTPGGINGKITIKAYLDASKIAISDTYDGNETDNMGTTNDWVNGRVTLTTEEWNALQDSGISFQVKVEANEDIWVEETLYDIIERQTVMDNINSTYVNNTTPGIDFSNISSDTNGKGVYTFSSTANDAYPVMYYRGAVTNNNVLFANKCWKMVRTTDTGGVKLIYNGENKGTEVAPDCGNTGTDTQITLNIDGQNVNTFAFNEFDISDAFDPAYMGYMYDLTYLLHTGYTEEGVYYGNDFTYDAINNKYTLINAKVGIDTSHHYTCNLTTIDGTCTNIRYYGWAGHYFELENGKSIYDILKQKQLNTTSSNAKAKIDEWYIGNLTTYASKLEDAIWCNDRELGDLSASSYNPNGGEFNMSTGYSIALNRTISSKPTLSCRENDSFTLPNGRGNGALSYPTALLTTDEIMLAGGKLGGQNSLYYLFSGTEYWTMSSAGVTSNVTKNIVVNTDGKILIAHSDKNNNGLRPSISLKNGIVIVDNDADGTVSKPYIVK